MGYAGTACTAFANSSSALRTSPACRNTQPRISARPAGVPTYCGDTAGCTKSGYFGVETMGSSTRFGAHAATIAAAITASVIPGFRMERLYLRDFAAASAADARLRGGRARVARFGREQIAAAFERVDRPRKLLHERLVRRIESGERRRVERNGMTEQETEILTAGSGGAAHGVGRSVEARRRRLELGQPDAALRQPAIVARDRIGRGGIADGDRRRLRRRFSVAHPARQRRETGLDDGVMRGAVDRILAALAAEAHGERRRLDRHPSRVLGVRRAGDFPSTVMRTRILSREMRTQRRHVALRLEVEHRDVDVRANVRARRNRIRIARELLGG